MNRSARLTKLALAFTSIYVIWGSTYLAIKFAIETLPPFWMAGMRFLLAGLLLYGWAAWRGETERLDSRHWRSAVTLGGLFFLAGNGVVSWAQQFVPSGLTSLWIATIPAWVVLMDWFRGEGVRPSGATVLGLVLGFTGIGILMAPGLVGGHLEFELRGAAALTFATIAWAAATVASRRAPRTRSLAQTTALQMIAGGLLLGLAGLAAGEHARLDLSGVSPRSIISVLYLVFFGSIVAFSAFTWLIRVTSPTVASTNAFVNPIVAVALGHVFAGEPITSRTMLAGGVIVVGVAILIAARGAGSPGRRSRARESGSTAS